MENTKVKSTDRLVEKIYEFIDKSADKPAEVVASIEALHEKLDELLKPFKKEEIIKEMTKLFLGESRTIEELRGGPLDEKSVLRVLDSLRVNKYTYILETNSFTIKKDGKLIVQYKETIPSTKTLVSGGLVSLIEEFISNGIN